MLTKTVKLGANPPAKEFTPSGPQRDLEPAELEALRLVDLEDLSED